MNHQWPILSDDERDIQSTSSSKMRPNGSYDAGDHGDEMTDSKSFDLPTNYEPHPSLECPPLYFMLEPFPRSLEKIRRFYQWRRLLAHPLGKRIPGSRFFRCLGWHVTYGDVLLVLPLVYLTVWCLIHTFLFPDVIATGKVSRGAVVTALLFGQKNSYVTMIFGLPFDRAVELHKLSGYTAVATGICHGIAYFMKYPKKSWLSQSVEDQMNTSGTVILAFLVLLFVTSLPSIRRKLFEVFYFLHLFCLIGVVGGTAFHTGVMVPLLVFGTSGLDFVIRKVYMERMRYPRKARIQVVSETVVEVSLPKTKGFDYNPGQYAYLTVPAISSFQAHPFSFASSPQESQIVFYVRRGGDWTNDLYTLAQDRPNEDIDLRIDGPYGNISMDLIDKSHRSRYPLVVLVSGGIGLTPLQSICTHLLLQHSMGLRRLNKIKMIWAERDPQLLLTEEEDAHVDEKEASDLAAGSHIRRTKRDDEEESKNQQNSQPSKDDSPSLAPPATIRDGQCSRKDSSSLHHLSQILASFPPGTDTDYQLDHIYEGLSTCFVDTTEENDDILSNLDEIDALELGQSNDEEDMKSFPTAIDDWLEAHPQMVKAKHYTSFETKQSPRSSKEKEETSFPCSDGRKLFEEHENSQLVDCRPPASSSIPDSADVTSLDAAAESRSNSSCPLGDQELCVDEDSMKTDFQKLYKVDDAQDSPKSHLTDFSTTSLSPNKKKNLDQEEEQTVADDILDVELYLTHKKMTDHTSFHQHSGIHYGRPNVAASLATMKDHALQLGVSRVAVLVCGPKRIAYVCRKACIELSDSQVRFDYHEERFG